MCKINDCVIISSGNNTYVIGIHDADATPFDSLNASQCRYSASEGDYISFNDGSNEVSIYVGGTSLTKEVINSAACISLVSLGNGADDLSVILVLPHDRHQETTENEQ